MTEPKFTSGPWKITRPFGETIFIKAGNPDVNDRTIVLVSLKDTKYEVLPNGDRLHRDIPIGDAEANASLIAAAPELYEALDELLPEGWRDGVMDHMPGVAKARAALAKARGEQ